jgi:hypothetical protein
MHISALPLEAPRKRPLLIAFWTLSSTLILGSTPCFGAALASDNAGNAAYSNGWQTGDNGGTGFAPWTLTLAGTASHLVGNSSLNGAAPSGDINTGGVAWGLSAEPAVATRAEAVRLFTAGGSNGLASLAVGESFLMSFDNGLVSAFPGSAGFSLQDAAGENRFTFVINGNESTYRVAGLSGASSTHGFTDDGMSTTFTMTSATTYAFTVNYNDGTPVSESFTGTLAPGGGIDRVRLLAFATGTGNSNTQFFNSMSIVPEPSSAALFITGALLQLLKRRRS